MSDLEWNPLFLPSSSVVSGLRWPCRDRAVSSALPFRPCNLWSAIFAPHLGQLCQRRLDEKHPLLLITRKILQSTFILPPRQQYRRFAINSIDYGPSTFCSHRVAFLASFTTVLIKDGRVMDRSILQRCFTMLVLKILPRIYI